MLQILFLFNVFVKHTSKKKNDKIVEGIFQDASQFQWKKLCREIETLSYVVELFPFIQAVANAGISII